MKAHDREYFYKYVTADVAYKILYSLQVKCSSPFLFNDPFDSQIIVHHDVRDEKDLVERTVGTICKSWKGYIKDGDDKGAAQIVCDEMLRDNNFVSERYQAFLRFYEDINKVMPAIAKTDRIFCVSEINDNLLMWAHYADNHTGVVIKLRCVPEKASALCAAKPIKYSLTMPLINMEDMFDTVENASLKLLEKILLTKSLDWGYEKEWRVVLKAQNENNDFDYRSLFADELDSIYLGCRISDKDKRAIIDMVRTTRKNIKVFESRKNDLKFELEFLEIDV